MYGLSPLEAQSVIIGVISPLLRRQTAAYTQDRAIADMQRSVVRMSAFSKQQQLAYETARSSPLLKFLRMEASMTRVSI